MKKWKCPFRPTGQTLHTGSSMIHIKVSPQTGDLDLPPPFPASPQGLVEAAKTLIRVRELAKAIDRDFDVYVELEVPEGTTRVFQGDLDYVLYDPSYKERSRSSERRPDQRSIQRGSGPLLRAAEVLGQT